MRESIRYVGLDVHAETIAVAVADEDKQVEALGIIPNRPESIVVLLKKLGPAKRLRVCYEAGPCGYVLYWQLTRRGVDCRVVAPTLIPVRSGDRVKTDRRDAEKLARLHRAGELTAVWVPDAEHEALRDVVRAREAAKKDELRSRNRLRKFLLRRGRRPPEDVKAWSKMYRQWLKTLCFEHRAQEATFIDYLHEVEHAEQRVARLDKEIDEAVALAPPKMRAVIEALQALRGVSKVTSVTVVAEVGELSRFNKPTQLMSYSGIVPSEHTSGERVHRGAITKTGNAHIRRVIGEAAWSYRYRPNIGAQLRKRQEAVSEEVKEIAWRAQHRLHKRYVALRCKGKQDGKAIVAIGRELMGFIWSIGVEVESKQAEPKRCG